MLQYFSFGKGMIMVEFIYGRVRRLHLKDRLFEIKIRGRVAYFYLSRSQMKQFNAYLQAGLFVHLKCNAKKVRHGFVFAYEVISFVKMIKPSHHQTTVYFDLETIRKGVQRVLNKNGYRMFLDLEFSMPPYSNSAGKDFIAEIIQYGFYLEDGLGQVVLKEDSLVKPIIPYALNARTCNFLNLKPSHFKMAISYKVFYRRLKYLIEKFKPSIFVWGKNDIIILEKSYEINKVKPITNRMNFINLMQIMKNYFGVKSDIGLFNAFQYFDEISPTGQVHDALSDALVMKDVYNSFKNYINEDE